MPKSLTDIRSLARSRTRTAINVLADIMNCTDATLAARAAAANAMLDRGWGKPRQAIEKGDEPFELIHKIERVIVHSENCDSYSSRCCSRRAARARSAGAAPANASSEESRYLQ